MSSGNVKTGTSGFPYYIIIRVALLIIYVTVTAVSGYVMFVSVRMRVAASELLPDFTIDRQEEGESPNVERVEGETLPVWTNTDRITVLIMGIDERAQEADDFWRTDTMILATLDPVTMRAGVLSIPRDLWVHIPGYTENRINTAYSLGDAYDHPGGGPALAVETVEYNLGVEIDYYVRFNFQAFVEAVDRIGGIDIEVPEDINDTQYPDYNYGYDPLYIEAGLHHFYGEEALKYARTRHTSGGDFDRARRQQQVILAIFDRVTNLNLLPQLALQAPDILTILENSIKIDPKLRLDEVIALANLGTQVDPENILFRVIDENCTLSKITPDEMMILVPLRDKIRDVRDEVFGLKQTNGQLDSVAEEAATISVLNGTTTSGLAYSTSQFLIANGISVKRYDNADRQDYDTSLVILNRAKPLTALNLLTLLNLPQSSVVNGANPTAEFDVVLILGDDFTAIQNADSP